MSVEGYYDGGETWRLRFAPDEEGDWQYLLRGEGVELFERGSIVVGPATGRGLIGIHPQNPYAFAYSDGTAFFPMGDTCYGLFDDTPITPGLRRQYLETRRQQRFNFVRMSIGHSRARAAADPAYWAWGGTSQQPDLDRLNPAFFHGFERLLLEMRSAGMNAELLLFNFYRRPFTDPAQWTASRERLWLRNVIARYSAFDNVFLWTASNEYETHPDGKYRLDQPGDVEWAKSIGGMVRQLDPYRHPYTVHPVVSSSAKGPSPRDPFDQPWRIGGFFGHADEVDVLSQQTSTPYAGTWDETLQAWTGDAAGVDASIAADRIYRKPVLNTEFGYEYLRGYATNKRQVHHTDKVRRAAWRIVCAGGYLAAGFISTIGHGDNWDVIDPNSKHPFLVKDEGAAGQLALLYDFFTALPFWRMQPSPSQIRGNGICLAIPGEVYVVYLPRGGTPGSRPGICQTGAHCSLVPPKPRRIPRSFADNAGRMAVLAGAGWQRLGAADPVANLKRNVRVLLHQPQRRLSLLTFGPAEVEFAFAVEGFLFHPDQAALHLSHPLVQFGESRQHQPAFLQILFEPGHGVRGDHPCLGDGLVQIGRVCQYHPPHHHRLVRARSAQVGIPDLGVVGAVGYICVVVVVPLGRRALELFVKPGQVNRCIQL